MYIKSCIRYRRAFVWNDIVIAIPEYSYTILGLFYAYHNNITLKYYAYLIYIYYNMYMPNGLEILFYLYLFILYYIEVRPHILSPLQRNIILYIN